MITSKSIHGSSHGLIFGITSITFGYNHWQKLPKLHDDNFSRVSVLASIAFKPQFLQLQSRQYLNMSRNYQRRHYAHWIVAPLLLSFLVYLFLSNTSQTLHSISTASNKKWTLTKITPYVMFGGEPNLKTFNRNSWYQTNSKFPSAIQCYHNKLQLNLTTIEEWILILLDQVHDVHMSKTQIFPSPNI